VVVPALPARPDGSAATVAAGSTDADGLVSETCSATE
jgi:hypothetical protein